MYVPGIIQLINKTEIKHHFTKISLEQRVFVVSTPTNSTRWCTVQLPFCVGRMILNDVGDEYYMGLNIDFHALRFARSEGAV